MNKKQIAGLAAGGAAALALGLAARATQAKRNAYTLDGKVALITGGSRGLGLVLARELGRRGAYIALCARNLDELERAQAGLNAAGLNCTIHVCDVTDQAQARATVEAVRSYYGRIDIVINNAGVIEVGPHQEMTVDDYREAMDTHFWAPLYVTEAALPDMVERKSGRIVNISSIGGKIPVPHLVPYCASKFALVGYSEALRAELLRDGVVVTTVCPGLMRTGSPENAVFKGKNKLEYAWFAVGDSMPGLTISAEQAAANILAACVRGEGEVILGAPAQIAATAYGVLPNVVLSAMAIAARLLPGPGGIGKERALGRESHSSRALDMITLPTKLAARRNNEVAVNS